MVTVTTGLDLASLMTRIDLNVLQWMILEDYIIVANYNLDSNYHSDFDHVTGMDYQTGVMFLIGLACEIDLTYPLDLLSASMVNIFDDINGLVFDSDKMIIRLGRQGLRQDQLLHRGGLSTSLRRL